MATKGTEASVLSVPSVPSGGLPLSQQVAHHAAVHIGETVAASLEEVGEAFVVDAELVAVLKLVAEPVSVIGRLMRQGEQLVLYADPADIRLE